MFSLHEAMELLCLLVTYEEVQQSILVGLVSLLKAQDDTSSVAYHSQMELSTSGRTKFLSIV